jgi:signal transduction histidine kinase
VQDEIHHAAFFFHHEPKAFASYRLRDAHASALLFAALLEEEVINQRLQSLSPLLQSGALAAGFGHEVFNKIQGLELQLRNLLPVHGSGEELQGAVTRALELTLDLKQTVQLFQQTLQHPEDQVTVDVNEVIERAERLLRPVSRKARVKVVKRPASDLPPVAGNPIALQQVFINIMLNAVQQMAGHHAGRRILEISTALDREAEKSVQVRFADTGPGIHKRLWEKIFAPGVSTRGGSGLGLYIARSFVQSFGGKIQVEESFVPLGTTFLIELQCTN